MSPWHKCIRVIVLFSTNPMSLRNKLILITGVAFLPTRCPYGTNAFAGSYCFYQPNFPTEQIDSHNGRCFSTNQMSLRDKLIRAIVLFLPTKFPYGTNWFSTGVAFLPTRCPYGTNWFAQSSCFYQPNVPTEQIDSHNGRWFSTNQVSLRDKCICAIVLFSTNQISLRDKWILIMGVYFLPTKRPHGTNAFARSYCFLPTKFPYGTNWFS